MNLGSIRANLEDYDYCKIIYNLSNDGCKRFEQEI